ncbi:hypothetical protein MMC13_005514 [Lambiella insularis]|nr:hypothetical protein [Lambiella insularis]
MSQSNPRPPGQFRHGTSQNSLPGFGRGTAQLYRRDSNMSAASFVSDVEMAHDEVFAGPMSESVPSSTTGFAHRRGRADSTASFTYLQDTEASSESSPWPDDEAVANHSDEEDDYMQQANGDLESGPTSLLRRKSSGFSRLSVEDPLLFRHDSAKTDVSGYEQGRRNTQKIYIVTEDLTVVFAGFSTSLTGYAVYISTCFISLGLGYLLLRWLPKWKVQLIGSPKTLRECSWVVIENQWGEFTIHDVTSVEYGHSVSTVFGPQSKNMLHEYDEEDDPSMADLRFLDYRYIRFVFHPLKGKFVLNNNFKDLSWTDVKSIRSGLDTDDRHRRWKVFGKNLIDLQQKSIPQLLFDEAFHPFYVFQIASLILWSLDEYYYYAACILLISVISITTTLLETRATMKRLREISRFECDARVLRNGFWRTVPSSELVPGDVYEVSDPALGQFPCDSLLLAGDCIVNESMLTGESVPVSKVPATDDSLLLLDLVATSIHPDVAKNFLFSGTKIIRARRPQDGEDDEAVALAIVVRTGFNTTKGALVRSMLFPKPSGFKFYRDSFRYISVMAGIAAVGFIASFINFIRLQLAWHLIVIRALDLITIVVPPALPATLTIGTNFALSRLKKKSIFCISPQRVNVGGKLDVMCFDKTGTLTEDGLDVLGVRLVHQPGMRFSDLLTDASAVLPGASDRDPTIDYGVHKAAMYTMATCHSLRLVDNVLVGDPLDYKMFDFTGWSFEEAGQKTAGKDDDEQNKLSPPVARPPAGMRYDIEDPEDPSIASYPWEMQFGAPSGDVYVKGAPECMKDICLPDSFPVDYEELLNYYTHRGFRVIACATKHISKLNWVKVQKMKREEAESKLAFVGFIVFENKLKPSTTGVIDELNGAGIRNIMCTGDNILTAISVARECHVLDRMAHCFVPHFAQGTSQDPHARLIWESVDNPIYQLDEKTLMPLPPPAEGDASLPHDVNNLRNYSLAVSGDVFRWVVAFGGKDVLRRMLACGQVFARMSPDEKHELVEKLQSIDYCCGFCGDGANDCGALKGADVGISLSEAEASVAAPFTSRIFDITEGRAALVTSFCCFKYMSLYSAIQFTSVSFLYASASNLADFQFLFIDLLLILPIAIFMGWTGAYPTLSRKRPTASLVSRKVLIPLLGQVLICILIQLIGFETVQQQQCEVVPFVVTIVAALLFSAYMLLDPGSGLSDFMKLTPLSISFKLFILILAAGGFVCAWIGAALGYFDLVLTSSIVYLPIGCELRRTAAETDKLKFANMNYDWLLDGGYLPQSVIRIGIRRQLRDRISIIHTTSLDKSYHTKMQYIKSLRTRPMAIQTKTANDQHYEVGTGVLQACLGPRMKYSCCLYPTGKETLGQAEVAMLDTYVEKAELKDGMRILDLGCGWGSGAIYFAELFPNSKVTAFSNSRTQKEYIDKQASLKGLDNLQVITGDVVNYEFEQGNFDRVVSIELFEHMKNYELLMAKISRALKPNGKLFVHIFTHATTPYDFEDGWMSTHFFTGGTMPSADLLLYFQKDLKLQTQWWVSGKHYAQTCEDWLAKMNASQKQIWPHLEETYGKQKTSMWFYRWQIFYMACAELFAYDGGDIWGVSHYLFEKPLSRES